MISERTDVTNVLLSGLLTNLYLYFERTWCQDTGYFV